MDRRQDQRGEEVKKTIKFGALSATLTQLAKGTHAGSWKITYRDAAGHIADAPGGMSCCK